jgi:hypothetical protein
VICGEALLTDGSALLYNSPHIGTQIHIHDDISVGGKSDRHIYQCGESSLSS